MHQERRRSGYPHWPFALFRQLYYSEQLAQDTDTDTGTHRHPEITGLLVMRRRHAMKLDVFNICFYRVWIQYRAESSHQIAQPLNIQSSH